MVALQTGKGIYGNDILYEVRVVGNKKELIPFLTWSELEERIRVMPLTEKVHVSEHSDLAKLLKHYDMGKITDEGYTPYEEIVEFILDKNVTGAVMFNRKYPAVYKLALDRGINARKVRDNATQGIDDISSAKPFVVALPSKPLSMHELRGRGITRHDEFTLA